MTYVEVVKSANSLPHVQIVSREGGDFHVMDVLRNVLCGVRTALSDRRPNVHTDLPDVGHGDDVQRCGVELVVEQVESELVQREVKAVPLVEEETAQEVAAL